MLTKNFITKYKRRIDRLYESLSKDVYIIFIRKDNINIDINSIVEFLQWIDSKYPNLKYKLIIILCISINDKQKIKLHYHHQLMKNIHNNFHLVEIIIHYNNKDDSWKMESFHWSLLNRNK